MDLAAQRGRHPPCRGEPLLSDESTSTSDPDRFAAMRIIASSKTILRMELSCMIVANRQRIALSRSFFFRHRIVYLKVGRSRHFIRQKCRFSLIMLQCDPVLRALLAPMGSTWGETDLGQLSTRV